MDNVDPLDQTPRRNALAALMNACRAVRNGSYFVRRGPINYPNFPYDTHPRTISVLIPEFDIAITGRMTVNLELVTSLRNEDIKRLKFSEGIADSIIEILIEDARWILDTAANQSDNQGNDVMDVVGGPPGAIEMVSQDWLIQGVRVTFEVAY